MFYNDKDIIGVPTSLGLGSTPSYVPITDSAFAVYSTHDLVASGGNVVRLVDSLATPTERDFTAKELIDGTYSSWAVSSTPYVATIYDQKGGTNTNFTASGATQQARYNSGNNSIEFIQTGQYTYSFMQTNTSTDIYDAFDGNLITNPTTISIRARKRSLPYTNPVGGRELVSIRDNFTPMPATYAEHRLIMLQSGTSYNLGVSMKTNGTYYTAQQFSNDPLGTSLETYTASFIRRAVSGVTVTDLDLYVDATQEIDATVTNQTSNISQDKFTLGNNQFETTAVLFFVKELTANEHIELDTLLSAL
jgi:hypothetical protein